MSKKYTTNFLEDTNGSTGSANQVLVSTAAGIDWVDGSGSGIIGGPYLPLSAGASYPLTDTLYLATASNLGKLQFGTANSDYYIRGGGNYGYININGPIVRFDTNASEKMRITSSGNVGIGTTTPGATLNIKNNIGAYPLIVETPYDRVGKFISTDAGAELIIQDNSSTNNGNSISVIGDIMTLRTAGSNRLRILANGNVGIGTTSPGAKLDVKDGSSAMRFQEYSNGASLFLDGADGDFIGGDYFNISAYGSTELAFGYGAFSKMVMKSTGNVGIGTTSPTKTLDVNGEIILGQTVSATVDASYLLARTYSGQSEEPMAMMVMSSGISNNTLNVGGGSSLYNAATALSFITAGTTATRQGSSRMYINSDGNVGIGTTSPSEKLDVNGRIRGDRFRTNVSGEATFAAYYFLGDADTGTFQPSNNTFAITTAGTERMRVTSAGNVGIGTTSPSFKLEVAGAGKFTGQVTIPATPVATTDAASKSYVDAQVGTADTLSEVLALGNTSGTNDISMLLGQKIYFNNDGENIRSIVNGDLELNSRTDLRIKANNNNSAGVGLEFWNGGSEKMRIDSSGNVGIGTTSPLAKLQVNSITASTMSQVAGEAHIVGVNHDLSDTQMGTLNLTSTSRDAGTNNQALGPSLTFSQNASKYVDGYEVVIGGIKTELMYTGNMNKSSIMNFYTHTNSGLTPKMSIDADGNVGIGTTSPSAKLEVRSDGANAGGAEIRLQHANNNTNDVVSTVNFANNIGSVGMIQAGTAGANNTGYIALFTDIAGTSSEKMRIHTNGNVGIGTTSPSQKLEVDGNVKAETLIATDLNDGYVPYSKSGTLGLQDSKIYTNGAHIGVGTTTLAAGCHITSLSDISATGYRVSAMQTAPSSRGDTGTLGEIRITADYIYVCYATDSWKRVAIAQW